MILLEAALLLFVVGPFVVWNNLQGWDFVGHLASAEFTARHLLPGVVGNNPWFFAGAPQNQLYPPALAYVSALLGRLIGVPLALKLLVGASVLLLPRAVAFCARRFGSPYPVAVAALVTLYLVVDPRTIGVSLQSTFEIGLAANAVAVPLLFVFLAVLREERRAAALLALLIVTHLVGGLIAILALPAFFAADRLRGLRIATLAFSLSAFFAVPMVLRASFGAPNVFSYDEAQDTLLEIALALALLLTAYAKDKRLLGFVYLCAGLFVARNFFFNDYLPVSGLHVHRFKAFEQLLMVFILAMLVARFPRVAVAACVSAIVLVAPRLRPEGVGAQPLPELAALSSRTLVVSGVDSQTSHHVVQHLLPMQSESLVGKGLFVEVAAHSGLFLDVERLVATLPVRSWGVRPTSFGSLTEIAPRAPQLLADLGIGYVLSNEPLRGDFTLERTLRSGFKLWKAPLHTALAQVVERAPTHVAAPEWDAHVRAWEGGAGLAVLDSDSLPTVSPAQLTGISHSPHWQRWSFTTSGPAAVLVRLARFPNWRAYDERGQAVRMWQASPYFMLVQSSGFVELRYEPQLLDRAAFALSLGVALALCFTRRRWMALAFMIGACVGAWSGGFSEDAPPSISMDT